MSEKPELGTIGWTDLTVPDADQLRDFYSAVAGWKPDPVSLGDYSDYSMVASSGEAVSGICHARGVNAGLPPQWLIYIVVDNLDERIEKCKQLGGKILKEAGPAGSQGRQCVIQDPAGAVAALWESA